MEEHVNQVMIAQWLAMAKHVVVAYSIKLIGVIVVLVLANLIAGWISRLTASAMRRRKVDPMVQGYLRGIIRITILSFAVIACLGIFGIQTTSFAAVLAAVGLAIGLAFQGSLSHLAAGFMLLIFRPFRVGDAVNVAGQLGVIDNISVFSTSMNTFDNRRVIIPNGSVFGAVIENLTHHEERRVEVEVGVAYESSIDRTREVLEAAAAAVPGRLDKDGRRPAVVLLKMGPSSINWAVRVWAPTATFWDVHQAAVRGVKQALDDANIPIPFPQMDVHVSGQK